MQPFVLHLRSGTTMHQRGLQSIGCLFFIGLASLAAGCGGGSGSTGAAGASGASSLVRVTTEPSGANCPYGGSRIESGIDANRNGTLDASEVDAAATSYVCVLGPGGTISPSTGIHVAFKPNGVSTSTTAPISVRFTLKDDRGFPLDLDGAYSLNAPIRPRFSIGSFTRDPVTGLVSPLRTSTRVTSAVVPAGQPTSYSPRGSDPGHGTLIENGAGAGDYTYTFPTTSSPNGPVAVAYDPARLDETHVVWIQATRQTDLANPLDDATFDAANQSFAYVPSGRSPPSSRQLVAQSRCDACHARFKAETAASAALHGGGRIDVGTCNVCHNPDHTSDPLADSASFIHRIHAGQQVAVSNLFHGIAAAYPKDLRACDACHGDAAQGAQALTNPSTRACQGCHDYVSFTNSAAAMCLIGGQLALGTDGRPLPCNHAGGQQLDSACATCHGPSASFATAKYHRPVVPPDPANVWLPSGTNANTNAAWIAAAGQVPAGADLIAYDVKSVDAVLDTSVTPNVRRPQITFKLKRNGADVLFQAYAPAAVPPVTELMPNFVGSPSVQFAFAVPQDGNPAPADFNATASGYLRRIWDGSATGAGAGTMTGPDASGYYTVRLTGVQVPASATMLTGGLGYSSSLVSAPPLVQTNVPGFPWVPNVPADGKAQGGLSVPPPNVWKAATGQAGRRAIVESARCNACHGALGVAPTFHAGQANDGPTCAFCHRQNLAQAGWSASAKYFIHAIHAGGRRTIPYTWSATLAGPGYDGVAFPGTVSSCAGCHVPGTSDFSDPASQEAVAQLPLTTVASGRYDPNPLVNSAFLTTSPYVVADGVTDYGAGFNYNPATNTTSQAAGTTLVLSPITASCVACHDSSVAIDHMTGSGGRFYAARATVLVGGAAQEQCLICHGPGRVAAIGLVHQR